MKKKIFCAAIVLVMVFAFVVPVGANNSNAAFVIPIPEATGRNVRRATRAEIDYSNIADGYVMARFLPQNAADANADLRVLVNCPEGVQYQYFLNTEGRWEVFPLSGGDGEYRVRVLERVAGGSFAVMVNLNVTVALSDEFAPFLRPNQFVNFHRRSNAVMKAAVLTRGSDNVIESVARVYNFVIENIEYDFELAATVRQPYIPDVDLTLKRGKGICFDYAALMTAMLRSQGIPTKLVIGYVGDLRHAWISVHSEEYGWINNIIWFDGEDWRMMDPTFAASSGQSDEIMRFIGDGVNHNPTHFH